MKDNQAQQPASKQEAPLANDNEPQLRPTIAGPKGQSGPVTQPEIATTATTANTPTTPLPELASYHQYSPYLQQQPPTAQQQQQLFLQQQLLQQQRLLSQPPYPVISLASPFGQDPFGAGAARNFGSSGFVGGPGSQDRECYSCLLITIAELSAGCLIIVSISNEMRS